jgi:gamma-glutamylcyclotransferase (GGCT)/AIG2-like uncharacterized protein YtfP
MKYIAYGSNMITEQMDYRCPDATLIGIGYIQRARLEFYLHATVQRSRIKADRVPVAVWEISEDDERNLDRYEGFPSYYTKEVWPVTLNGGSQIKGMIYLMKRIRTAPPTVSYYNGIFNAYNTLGLGSEIGTVLEPALRRALQRKG